MTTPRAPGAATPSPPWPPPSPTGPASSSSVAPLPSKTALPPRSRASVIYRTASVPSLNMQFDVVFLLMKLLVVVGRAHGCFEFGAFV